jgi:hypothetical protein
VFVQTDNTAGNAVVAYHRSSSRTLTRAGSYQTGGLLVAVKAGSNTISVFGVRGDRLRLQQVTNSGGALPVTISIHGVLAYVLNAERAALSRATASRQADSSSCLGRIEHSA